MNPSPCQLLTGVALVSGGVYLTNRNPEKLKTKKNGGKR